MKATVELKNVVTGYEGGRRGRVVVSSPLTATLPSGALTCLLGRNGSGKSTLMRTIAGFQPPLSGEVMVEGQAVASMSRRDKARALGVVLTERPRLDHTTVAALVALGRSPYTDFLGATSDEDERICREALAMVGISELADRLVATLSDGERQKAMIAKAIAQQTPVILLDEPAAFLDYPSKVETMRLLKRLAREEGKTVFLSTHDLEIALRTADEVWLLDRELGLAEGTPSQLASDGTIDRYFGLKDTEFDPTLFLRSNATSAGCR